MKELSELAAYLQASSIGQYIINTAIVNNELVILVLRDNIRDIMYFLKGNKHYNFQMLVDLCGADYPDRVERFEVVYNLLSVTSNLRIRIKITVDANNLVPSISDIYSSSGWYEREAWDMYGIYFAGHNDLRRILTDYGFTGHPMRKDFPLTGFEEVRYDLEQAKVVYEKVKLTQDFRNFDFSSPWDSPDYILPGDEKATQK